MKKQLCLIALLFISAWLLADALRDNAKLQRIPYARDIVKIKLSADAIQRSSLPTGLYAESASFQINELDQLMNRNGGQKIIRAHRQVKNTAWQNSTGFDRWFLIKLDGRSSVEAAIASFKANRYIEDAIPEYYAYTTAVPNDTYYANNWGHNNTAQLPVYSGSSHSGAGVGTIGYDSDAQLAWDQSQGYGSSSIIIAIIDSGVDTAHADLRLVEGYDYGDNDSNPMDDSAEKGHGTACAGIAAAKANNSLGITGVAGGCSVMPIKVADSAGSMAFTSITNAITHAADNGADIISMSLGAEGGMGEGDNAATDTALYYAYNAGVVILAATANANAAAIAYPSNHTRVISVGASSPTGQRKSTTSSDGENWWGSNYGTTTRDDKEAVDIMAPTILPATDISGSTGYSTTDYSMWFNGTSCATPYAAGVAGLILSKDPNLSPAQVWTALTTTTTDMTLDGGLGWDRYTGYGMVNANAALSSIVSGMPACSITSPASGSVHNLNSTISISVTATDSDGTINSVKFYVDGSATAAYTDSSSPYSWAWNTTGLSAGTHTVKAIATDNSNNTSQSEISVNLLAPADEGFETGNFSAYSWANSSAVPWTVQNTEKYSGIYAAKSGAIGNSAVSSLAITLNITSAGNISFFQKVSSESGYDFLKFYVDDVETGSWSGIGNWTLQSYAISTGYHTFRWTYSKDTSDTGGSDCAWIDHINFPPNVVYYAPPQSLSANSGNAFVQLNWAAPSSGTPTGYKIYKNSSYLTTVTGLSYTDSAVQNDITYAYYLRAIYSGGESEPTGTVNATPTAVSIPDVVLGTGTTISGTSAGCPINIYYKSLHGQSVYTQAELTAAGIVGPVYITKIGFYIASSPTLALPNFIIRMKHTSATNVAAWQTATDMVTVYSNASYMPVSGAYQMLTLSTPFLWNGTGNIVVDTAFGLVSTYTSTGTVQVSTVTSGYRYTRNDTINQTDVFSGTETSTSRPNLKLSFAPLPTPQTIPFAEGFENGLNNWTAVNGSQSNYWVRGSAAYQTGNSGLYISNNGSNNAYTITSAAVSHVYRDISIPAGSESYKLRFAWKGQGEANDFLKVYLTDTNTFPVAGTQLASGQLGLAYNLANTWQETSLDIPVAMNGTSKRLVYTWTNNSSTGTQAPAAIDNIRVVAGEQSDAAVIINEVVIISPPPVNDPLENPILTDLSITGLGDASGYITVSTGYGSVDSPALDAGLDFVFSGTDFAGATISFSHNLGYTPYQLTYKIGDSGMWSNFANPGSWTDTEASFTVPAAKGEHDVFIAFSDSEEGTLPITLSSFMASLSGTNKVRLEWITATETGVLGYYIYRANTDALATAEQVSPLIGGTNSSTEQAYMFTDAETEANTQYYYWLEGLDMDGGTAIYGPAIVNTLNSPDNPDTPVLPQATELSGNYPNPFNPSTTIRYALVKAATVDIRIYNHRGQCVQNYKVNHNSPGFYSLPFVARDASGRNLSSGIYYCRMIVGKQVYNRKMVLMK